MPFAPDKPYNDLPLLPLKAELETKAVLRKTIAANKALAELNGGGVCFMNLKLLDLLSGQEEGYVQKTGILDRFLGYVHRLDISLRELIWL